MKSDNAFVTRVWQQPKMWPIGSETNSMHSALENLCGPGKPLEAEAPDGKGIAGFLRTE